MKDVLNEALRIDGFTPEQQHAFDKLAAYFSVFKSRANPASKRYVTKLNEFQLKFRDFLDQCETNRAKIQVKTFITEILGLIEDRFSGETVKKNKVLGGGKLNELPAKKEPKRNYASEKGGEYWDDDVHVYEMPAED